MVNEIISKFLDFDEDRKDEKWASAMAWLVIRDAQQIISKEKYEEGKNILFGQFPGANLDKIFSGPAMQRIRKKIPESTVYFFEKVRNALIDERNSSGLTITVNSLDPEKENKKKQDRELLQNRKGIEALMNEFTSGNGMPPKKYEKDDFHGNVEDFDNMGYDEMDDTDVENFFSTHWGLQAERELQNPLNAIFRLNQVSRKYDKYINDILICLHTWSQVYVDEFEGSTKIEHLYPWQVNVLHATGSNDYKDAQGFDIKKQTNIRGLFRRFGSSYRFEDHWEELMTAANSGNILHGYTGLSEGGMLIYGDGRGKIMDFKMFLDSPINYGYVEFKTVNKKSKQYGVDTDGRLVRMPFDSNTPPIDGFDIEEKYYEDTYRAYYLDMGNFEPKLIKWGKLYMQEIEGFEDEYSGFSIKGNTREGVPMVEILKPFWNILNVSFKMLEMLINDIKPDGLIINYSSIIKVAEYLKSATDVPNDKRNGIEEFMKMVEESPNLLADTPTTDENEPLGGGNLGIQTKKNGLNQAAVDLMKIMDWVEQKVENYLGTQGIEFAEPRDGFKLSLENKKRTRAATAFIDFILLNHLEDISTTVLNYVKDISGFKDLKCYKNLEALVGCRVLDFIKKMEKAPHRFGIFLDTFNNDIPLMEIRGRAGQSLDQKEITLEQYMVLCSIENPKQAASYLAYERKKAEKQRQKEAMTELKQQDALNEAEFQRKLKLETLKGKWRGIAEDKRAAGFITASQNNSLAQITTQQMQQEGQDKRLAESAINDINKIAETATQNAQQPVRVG